MAKKDAQNSPEPDEPEAHDLIIPDRHDTDVEPPPEQPTLPATRDAPAEFTTATGDDGHPALAETPTIEAANPAMQLTVRSETEVIHHPATTKQKVALAALLAGSTFILLLMTAAALYWVQSVSYQAVPVDWVRKSDAQLATGPVGFRYVRPAEGDTNRVGKLIYVGPMSDETRKRLVTLFPTEFPDEQADEYRSDAESYLTAVDTLADESLLLTNKYLLALLLLGGFCGMVGVQLRSMWDFVRNICFKDPQQLDVVTWWPWYLMRPIIGFVLGILAISLIMSGFLEVGNQSPRSTLWWLSITALVGFGASEFMGRLRLVVAALFATQG